MRICESVLGIKKLTFYVTGVTPFMQCSELACESIPGCVLQIFIVVTKTGFSGAGPLVSIGISALTTGFASAIIAFDKDVDAQGRKINPKFYGYIPDDHGLRSRCFLLMMMMSACHNLSRSVGCALLAALGGTTFLLSFVGGEMMLYLVWKVCRCDFMAWFPVDGAFGVLLSLFSRVVVKVIADFSGCLLFR